MLEVCDSQTGERERNNIIIAVLDAGLYTDGQGHLDRGFSGNQ